MKTDATNFRDSSFLMQKDCPNSTPQGSSLGDYFNPVTQGQKEQATLEGCLGNGNGHGEPEASVKIGEYEKTPITMVKVKKDGNRVAIVCDRTTITGTIENGSLVNVRVSYKFSDRTMIAKLAIIPALFDCNEKADQSALQTLLTPNCKNGYIGFFDPEAGGKITKEYNGEIQGGLPMGEGTLNISARREVYKGIFYNYRVSQIACVGEKKCGSNSRGINGIWDTITGDIHTWADTHALLKELCRSSIVKLTSKEYNAMQYSQEEQFKRDYGNPGDGKSPSRNLHLQLPTNESVRLVDIVQADMALDTTKVLVPIPEFSERVKKVIPLLINQNYSANAGMVLTSALLEMGLYLDDFNQKIITVFTIQERFNFSINKKGVVVTVNSRFNSKDKDQSAEITYEIFFCDRFLDSFSWNTKDLGVSSGELVDFSVKNPKKFEQTFNQDDTTSEIGVRDSKETLLAQEKLNKAKKDYSDVVEEMNINLAKEPTAMLSKEVLNRYLEAKNVFIGLLDKGNLSNEDGVAKLALTSTSLNVHLVFNKLLEAGLGGIEGELDKELRATQDAAIGSLKDKGPQMPSESDALLAQKKGVESDLEIKSKELHGLESELGAEREKPIINQTTVAQIEKKIEHLKNSRQVLEGQMKKIEKTVKLEEEVSSKPLKVPLEDFVMNDYMT
ncbi:MAG: hypothetical protein V4591_11235 [Bdellovibrionota bacterium]